MNKTPANTAGKRIVASSRVDAFALDLQSRLNKCI
jgi:hypothetical protein